MLTGQRIVKEIGLGGIPVTNVDNACSAGATALHDAVLVVGVDKLTQFGSGTLPLVAEDLCAHLEPALLVQRAEVWVARLIQSGVPAALLLGYSQPTERTIREGIDELVDVIRATRATSA